MSYIQFTHVNASDIRLMHIAFGREGSPSKHPKPRGLHPFNLFTTICLLQTPAKSMHSGESHALGEESFDP